MKACAIVAARLSTNVIMISISSRLTLLVPLLSVNTVLFQGGVEVGVRVRAELLVTGGVDTRFGRGLVVVCTIVR
jgi:hypothetical protein